MIRTDERAGIVIVVTDALVNPPAGPDAEACRAAFDALVAGGAGLIILPPEVGTEDEVRRYGRDVVDYLRHGYRLGAIDLDDDPTGRRWRAILDDEVRHWDHEPPAPARLPRDGAGEAVLALLRGLGGDQPFQQRAATGLGG